MRECKNPNCLKPFEPRKGGRPQLFCSETCWREANREDQNAKKRTWHADHREEANAGRLARYLASREDTLPKFRAYYQEHREEQREKGRQWFAEHRDEDNERRKQHYHANKDANRPVRRDKRYEARLTTPWQKLLSGARERAKRKGIPYDLTNEWAANRWTGNCELTNIPFRLGLLASGPKFFSPSIDRIVPSLGYTQSNCRFILWSVNAMKYNGTDDDVIMLARLILQYADTKTVPP